MADFWADDEDYKAAREAYEAADRERRRLKALRAAERERNAADKRADRLRADMEQAKKRAKGKHRKR